MIAAAVAGAALATLAPAAAAAVESQAPPAASVRFAVKGDWGYGGAAQAAVTRRMCVEARRAPFAFVLTTGDNFYRPDGVATAENYWRPERCLRAARVRWRAAWGNHDAAGGDTAARARLAPAHLRLQRRAGAVRGTSRRSTSGSGSRFAHTLDASLAGDIDGVLGELRAAADDEDIEAAADGADRLFALVIG